jgi:hypothetical protein
MPEADARPAHPTAGSTRQSSSLAGEQATTICPDGAEKAPIRAASPGGAARSGVRVAVDGAREGPRAGVEPAERPEVPLPLVAVAPGADVASTAPDLTGDPAALGMPVVEGAPGTPGTPGVPGGPGAPSPTVPGDVVTAGSPPVRASPRPARASSAAEVGDCGACPTMPPVAAPTDPVVRDAPPDADPTEPDDGAAPPAPGGDPGSAPGGSESDDPDTREPTSRGWSPGDSPAPASVTSSAPVGVVSPGTSVATTPICCPARPMATQAVAVAPTTANTQTRVTATIRPRLIGPLRTGRQVDHSA